jgi:hypothetical protein
MERMTDQPTKTKSLLVSLDFTDSVAASEIPDTTASSKVATLELNQICGGSLTKETKVSV